MTDTIIFGGCARVTSMVTHRRPQPIYLREWRKFMGVKAVALAEALKIERESYYRLERETFRISLEEVTTLAGVIGIRPDQLWWHPPTPEAAADVNLNDLLEGASKADKLAAIRAVRGIVGK